VGERGKKSDQTFSGEKIRSDKKIRKTSPKHAPDTFWMMWSGEVDQDA
jgi:hypothetical protein